MVVVVCILAAWLVLVPLICLFIASASHRDGERARALAAQRRFAASRPGSGRLSAIR
jgi:hypothetical protein